jgi:surfactin synthase thioesterase subunit
MADKLFFVAKPVTNPRVRIFCFPFAGGSINTYLPWVCDFADDVELVLIQPPGRGSRMLEKPHECMQDYINELFVQKNYFTKVPYILFGHSLGARVAFELASQLTTGNCPPPLSVVASGSRAPHLNNFRAPTFDLSDEALTQAIARLNGTPTDIIQNKEIMSLMLPLLRADFKISETYIAKKFMLPFPIVVFYGDCDPSVNLDEVEAWRELSLYDTEINMLTGDHFFINKHKAILTKRIAQLTLNS